MADGAVVVADSSKLRAETQAEVDHILNSLHVETRVRDIDSEGGRLVVSETVGSVNFN